MAPPQNNTINAEPKQPVAQARKKLTAARLRELLRYSRQTGRFHWRESRAGLVAGTEAGSPGSFGYSVIGIDGRRYLAHRLAWLYVYGKHPAGPLDHINRGQRRGPQPRAALKPVAVVPDVAGPPSLPRARRRVRVGAARTIRDPCCCGAC